VTQYERIGCHSKDLDYSFLSRQCASRHCVTTQSQRRSDLKIWIYRSMSFRHAHRLGSAGLSPVNPQMWWSARGVVECLWCSFWQPEAPNSCTSNLGFALNCLLDRLYTQVASNFMPLGTTGNGGLVCFRKDSRDSTCCVALS